MLLSILVKVLDVAKRNEQIKSLKKKKLEINGQADQRNE